MARKPLRKKQKQTPKCIAIDCETVNEKRNGLFTPHAGATAHNRYKYSIFCAPLFSFLIEKKREKTHSVFIDGRLGGRRQPFGFTQELRPPLVVVVAIVPVFLLAVLSFFLILTTRKNSK